MMRLTRYESSNTGTFGILELGNVALHTVERPWLNNKPFESCVPPGIYELKPFTRPNGDKVLCLTNDEYRITEFQEPGCSRYTILIHAGNFVDDVVGCIAPGLSRDGYMVKKSREAMKYIIASTFNEIAIDFGVTHVI